MAKTSKKDLVNQVIVGARENSIGAVLFHQAVGRMLGINVTDVKCLDVIALRGSATPSQLALLTGLSTGSTTALIDRLEKRRLVERRPNPQDRRGIIIALTKEAQSKLPNLFDSLARAMEVLVSSYSDTQLKTLLTFFRRISQLWTEERKKLQLQGSKPL